MAQSVAAARERKQQRLAKQAKQNKLLSEYRQGLGIETDEKGEEIPEDIKEIGCKRLRMWTREIEVLCWSERGKTVLVRTPDAGLGRYEYPFHKTAYQAFFTFEILEDIDYVERFANGWKVETDRGVFGIDSKDKVWVMDGKYVEAEGRKVLPATFSELGLVVKNKSKIFI